MWEPFPECHMLEGHSHNKPRDKDAMSHCIIESRVPRAYIKMRPMFMQLMVIIFKETKPCKENVLYPSHRTVRRYDLALEENS